jgi:hypothetical protein
MLGNKNRLFLVGLSFIGWFLLSYGASFIFESLLDSAPSIVSRFALPVIRGVVTAPVYVYAAAVFAIFYDILTGRRRLLPTDGGFYAGGGGDGGAPEIWHDDAADGHTGADRNDCGDM